ncbi:MAG: hypothetical protein KBC84_01610 [Proteobacteria bacterium]|nr:hypothetical protein [Pseudomonadota bacterium]
MSNKELLISEDIQTFEVNDFQLLSGEILPKAKLGYYVYGTNLNNPILVLHPALTSSAKAAFGPKLPHNIFEIRNQGTGWWNKCIGQSAMLDTDKYTIICVDHLGGDGYSSTASELWHYRHKLSLGDTVFLTTELLKNLKINEIFGVIGGSIGGGQIHHWLFQDVIKLNKLIDISGSHVRDPISREFFAIQADILDGKDSIENILKRFKINSKDIVGKNHIFDHVFKFVCGKINELADLDSKSEENKLQILKVVRQMGYTRFVNPLFFKHHAERLITEGNSEEQALNQIEQWLIIQGDSFVKRFSYQAQALLCRLVSTTNNHNSQEVAEKIAEKNVNFYCYTVLGDNLYFVDKNLNFWYDVKANLADDKNYLINSFLANDEINGHAHFLDEKFLENVDVVKGWLEEK